MMSMAFTQEYNMDLELGIFKTDDDIKVVVGQGSFRELNPNYYYNLKTNNILNKNLEKPEHNFGHYNNTIEPIFRKNIDSNILNSNGKSYWIVDILKPLHIKNKNTLTGELFITDCEDLNKIKLIDTYKINKDNLYNYVKDLLIKNRKLQLKSRTMSPMLFLPDTIDDYISRNILTPIKCQSGGKRRMSIRKKYRNTKRLLNKTQKRKI